VDRRRFLLTSLAGALAVPLAAGAQQTAKIWRIGTLHTSSEKDEAERVAALERGLAELGYLAGRNVLFVNRNAGPQMGAPARPRRRSGPLRGRRDRHVSQPGDSRGQDGDDHDPDRHDRRCRAGCGWAGGESRKPWGQRDGLTFDVDAAQLAAKRLEILQQLLPSVSRVAVLWNPSYGPGTLRFKGTEDAGRKLGITIVSSSSRREATPSARSRKPGVRGPRR
jgi:hypothetical protein